MSAIHVRRSSFGERAPLLSGSKTDYSGVNTSSRNGQAIEDYEAEEQSYKKEFFALWGLTIPLWLTYLLEYLINAITTVIVGHIGTTELNAASLANLIMTSSTIALLIYGPCAALDTLATQAYTSDNPKNMSLYTLRTAFLIYVLLIPACIGLTFAERFLLFIKQEPVVAHLAAQYINVAILGIPFIAMFELCRRWLQVQGLVKLPTIALLVAVPLNIGLGLLLVFGPPAVRIGFLGAAVSSVVTEIILCAFLMTYIVFYAPKDAWCGWSTAIFQDLGPNVRLGFAGMISVSSEWLAWDFVSIASSYLSPIQFAVNQIAILISVTMYQLPWGLSVGTGIRVGNFVGAGQAEEAKFAAKVSWLSAICLGLFNSTMILIFRKKIGWIFSSDEEVIDYLATVVPIIAIFQVVDVLTGSTQGILRGAGLASLTSWANVAAYYVLGIPTAMYLGFKAGWGVSGLWTGHTVALTVTATLLTIASMRIDWPQRVIAAKAQADSTEAYLQARRDEAEERDVES